MTLNTEIVSLIIVVVGQLIATMKMVANISKWRTETDDKFIAKDKEIVGIKEHLTNDKKTLHDRINEVVSATEKTAGKVELLGIKQNQFDIFVSEITLKLSFIKDELAEIKKLIAK